MSILIIAEHDNKRLRSTTLNTLQAATQLNKPLTLLIAGFNCNTVVDTAKQFGQLDKIIVADHHCYEHFFAESMASLIQALAADYTHVLMPATSFGRNCLARAAALMGCGQVSDVIEIVDQNTYKRPIYAGNAIATVQTQDQIQFLTIRPSSFDALQPLVGDVTIETCDQYFETQKVRFVSEEKHKSDRPELASADIVISGGRGLGDKDNFNRLYKLADKLNAAVGASRAAVDGGLAPNDFQVGQTGQIVSPKLYIAFGISGAIQHLAGMKDSKTVVAINKDPDAPIFEVADYGLVADVNDVLSEWEAHLAAQD